MLTSFQKHAVGAVASYQHSYLNKKLLNFKSWPQQILEISVEFLLFVKKKLQNFIVQVNEIIPKFEACSC